MHFNTFFYLCDILSTFRYKGNIKSFVSLIQPFGSTTTFTATRWRSDWVADIDDSFVITWLGCHGTLFTWQQVVVSCGAGRSLLWKKPAMECARSFCQKSRFVYDRQTWQPWQPWQQWPETRAVECVSDSASDWWVLLLYWKFSLLQKQNLNFFNVFLSFIMHTLTLN